jgi:hypothetical protein
VMPIRPWIFDLAILVLTKKLIDPTSGLIAWAGSLDNAGIKVLSLLVAGIVVFLGIAVQLRHSPIRR